MYKHVMFAIASAVLMTAIVTVALNTVNSANAQGNMTSGGKNMTNATAGAAKNMTGALKGAASGAMGKIKSAIGGK